MMRNVLAVAAALGLAAPALADPPSPDPKSLTVPQEELSKARELVRKLGSETFIEREDAEHNLAAMGRIARTALLDGATTDPDPEIRTRSQTLLSRATALEMKARLETFLADTEGQYEHDLPGWNKLRSVVRGDWAMFGWTWTGRPGTDRAARELFVEFLKAPGGRHLLTALGSGVSDLGPEIAALKQDLYYAKYPRGGGVAPRNPTAMEVAVVVFADSQVSFRGGARNTLFTNVLQTSGIVQAANGTDEKAKALRAVLMAWFDSRTDPYEMYYSLTLATSLHSDDTVGRLAVRLLGSAGAPASYRAMALAALVKLPSKDQHVPTVEKLIGDATVVATIATIVDGKRVQTTIHVGDMALAAAVLMTGQKVEDYGIEDRLKGNTTASISYTRFSIPDDKRKEAAEKWKAWREKNP